MRHKKHRGMTLIETIAALMLTATLITLLISLAAYANVWTFNAHQTMSDKIDTDFFVESMQADVKSADIVEVDGENLHVINDSNLVVYSIFGDTVYRNTEKAVDKIISGDFSVLDENTISIFIRFQNGAVIDMLIRK